MILQIPVKTNTQTTPAKPTSAVKSTHDKVKSSSIRSSQSKPVAVKVDSKVRASPVKASIQTETLPTRASSRSAPERTVESTQTPEKTSTDSSVTTRSRKVESEVTTSRDPPAGGSRTTNTARDENEASVQHEPELKQKHTM